MTLACGEQVAWVMKSGGKTSGVSSVHRVFENGKTYCNHIVPPEDRRLPILPLLSVCRRCEVLYNRARGRAAQMG